jgi:hypothetical protein
MVKILLVDWVSFWFDRVWIFLVEVNDRLVSGAGQGDFRKLLIQ